MTIENEIKTRRISFTRVESVKGLYPSQRVHIEIETENIKANLASDIWISDVDIEEFLVELDSLNRSHKGEATLESMGTGEMTLTFKTSEISGHLSVALQLVNKDSENKDYSFDVSVEFQADPTSLMIVKNDLIKLME